MAIDLLLLCIVPAILTHQPIWLVFAAFWLLEVVREAAWLHSQHNRRGKQYIYFFADRGQLLPTVKIGRASNIKARLASHRTAAPFGMDVFLVLMVHSGPAIEREIHYRYSPLRLRKRNEWFYMPLWLWAAMALAKGATVVR